MTLPDICTALTLLSFTLLIHMEALDPIVSTLISPISCRGKLWNLLVANL